MRFYNTLTRHKETFRPRRADRVAIFDCGPSVYQAPHLGNLRTFLYEGLRHRYLEYRGYEVRRVMNLTDVEDKSIHRAAVAGLTVHQLTAANIRRFRRDAGRLGIRLPRALPRASAHVDDAVTIIRRLLDRGSAYWHRGDVFFDPLRYPGFGRLYGLDMSRWPKKRVRFRRDTYTGNRWNRGDFILWHGMAAGERPAWDTAIGRGRPAWNVQDPAVIVGQLGGQVDIAAGGVDNLYRHHDYTLAVTESFTGRKLARTWMHGEHLLVEGAKMSKSRGNIVHLDDLLDRGFTPAAVRAFLLSAHYRQRLNCTTDALRRVQGELERVRNRVVRLLHPGLDGRQETGQRRRIDAMRRDCERHLDDDLDVPGAWAAIRTGLDRLPAGKPRALAVGDARHLESTLRRLDEVLGFVAPAAEQRSGS